LIRGFPGFPCSERSEAPWTIRETKMNETTTRTTPRPNNLTLLDPSRVRLEKDRPGWLCCRISGEDEEEVRVKPVRTFPLTDPEHYISLLDEDENEVGVIEDPLLLEPESRQELSALLMQTYFLPTITKIKRIVDDYGVYRWDVETDKGEKTFEIRNRDDVRFVANGHVMVRDIDGNRYHITRIGGLDPESRTYLELLL
jgi:hypothetical protein